MPLFTIEEDAANKTYKFTETPITDENGVPSGSNWISLTPNSVGNGNYFRGEVEGNYKTIKGLRIIGSEHTCGFIGYMQGGGYIKNLTFDDAVVYSTYGYVGTAVGYSQDGSTVENVHVTNSTIKGSSNIGGVVGYNYRRIKTGKYDEELAYITNCSTDKNTIVVGTSSIVGGICGSNYGAVMYNCVNNADVTGKTHVAGIAGHSRDYWINVNGYVVACGTTKEATITATDGDAGGLVGYSVKDTNHENSVSYIVACYSLSTISAKNAGTMIGYNANGSATATWAKKNSINRYAGFFELEDDARNASEHFSSASEITEEFVNEMNATIENYNATEGVEQQCEYRWKYVANDWPILTK